MDSLQKFFFAFSIKFDLSSEQTNKHKSQMRARETKNNNFTNFSFLLFAKVFVLLICSFSKFYKIDRICFELEFEFSWKFISSI